MAKNEASNSGGYLDNEEGVYIPSKRTIKVTTNTAQYTGSRRMVAYNYNPPSAPPPEVRGSRAVLLHSARTKINSPTFFINLLRYPRSLFPLQCIFCRQGASPSAYYPFIW